MTQFQKKRILLIITGGTISGNVAAREVAETVKHGSESFKHVLQRPIEILKRDWALEVEVATVELCNIDSSDMLPSHWKAIIETVAEAYDRYDAFIVVHGTNTMGYTCAALTFALENINKPVIVTGAQVPLGYLGTDATTNLVNALRLASWEYHLIKGVVAVFGSKIISGVRVKKGSDFDYDPFSSFIKGALGQIGRYIRIDVQALEKYISYLSRAKPLAIQSKILSVKKEFDTSCVVSLTEFPGMSPKIFRTLVEGTGTKAFIFRAFGAGDVSMHLMSGFEYLKEKKIPIIVTTQAPSGVASFQVNENGKFLKDNDLAIPAFDMSIESITTKLAWLLAQGVDYANIKHCMLEDLHGEITVENELL